MAKEHTYAVKGMHCAACEVLIEKKLLEMPGVKAADASTNKGQAVVEYEGEQPRIDQLNAIFKKDNYTFFDNQHRANALPAEKKPVKKTLVAFNIAVGVVIIFLILDRMGVSAFLSVGSTSSAAAFLGFGLLAGLSSCAALVGGIVLSMSKQWHEIYAAESSMHKKLQPHALFNAGRVLSYIAGGAALGAIGNRLQISLGFVAMLVLIVSVAMIGLGLQMLGVGIFRKFQFSTPKFLARYIADENNFKGKYMPFVMGAATFFLPCGFTITVQTIALLTGSLAQGALIMGAFALGTAPMLLLIGLSSARFFSRPHIALTFSKIAGFLVIFFALFNIANQMSVLGVGFQDRFFQQSVNQGTLPPIINGQQVVEMTVYATSYSPDFLKVKSGVPVRWEITASGQPSCGSGAIVSNILPSGSVYLNPNRGQVTVAEFIPQKPGTYRFACPMGMVRGVMEVVN